QMSTARAAEVMSPSPLARRDGPTRGDFLRGFFENVAFAIRGNCEQITALTEDPIERLWVSGGMTQSPTLLGLIGCTLQLPLVVGDVPESASLGSAVLAALGCGLHRGGEAGVAAMVRTHVVEPDCGRGQALDGRYHHWREIYATF